MGQLSKLYLKIQHTSEEYKKKFIFCIQLVYNNRKFVLRNSNRAGNNNNKTLNQIISNSCTVIKAKTPGYDPEVLETYVRIALHYFRQQYL
jgi:hypothetical protein